METKKQTHAAEERFRSKGDTDMFDFRSTGEQSVSPLKMNEKVKHRFVEKCEGKTSWFWNYLTKHLTSLKAIGKFVLPATQV